MEAALGEDRHEPVGGPLGDRSIELDGSIGATDVGPARPEEARLCPVGSEVGGRCDPYRLGRRLDRGRRRGVNHHRATHTAGDEAEDEGEGEEAQAIHDDGR